MKEKPKQKHKTIKNDAILQAFIRCGLVPAKPVREKAIVRQGREKAVTQ